MKCINPEEKEVTEKCPEVDTPKKTKGFPDTLVLELIKVSNLSNLLTFNSWLMVA